ncbi:MAG TPA: hypothetical protein VJ885_03300 [Thermoanaerobaculia bacterium]|nr:hypothetical protein [Thermoanaerobaculia bacterium]
MVCVPGEPDRIFRQALESYGAEVRTVSPAHQRGRAADRLQLFPESGRETRRMRSIGSRSGFTFL